MNKDLLSDIIVTAVLIVGSIVQFLRGKKIFAWVGLIAGLLYLLLVVATKVKSNKNK